jgi:hypothetical protein|tara:strand:+ start:304 stop:498 length:195 start_codon:yes stop_codon:yes gene_type:complete
MKRKLFGGGKTHSGLWGLGSSNKDMARAKADDKKADDQAEFKRRMGDPRNKDKSIFDTSKGLFK